ncbi:MAG: hypothetical protein NZO58_10740 [Gemmataceae bacterium]|nr:hypothetical protein [Gemmataceae bacterium]
MRPDVEPAARRESLPADPASCTLTCMSYDAWDDELLPRRRRRRDLDDIALSGHPMRPQSGIVTAVGIISIIKSVLFLLYGGFFGMCGLFCAAVGIGARNQGGFPPPDLFERAGGIIFAWGFAHLVLGVGLLIGGIVVLQRRNWGRILLLACAAAIAFLGATPAVVAIMDAMDEAGGFFGNAQPEDRIGLAVFGMCVTLIYLAYAIVVFLVLLNRNIRAEFD